MRGLFLSLLVLALCAQLEAKVVYVSLNGDGSTGNSWEGAYPTIQAGIDSATAGDELWIREGVYSETLDAKSGIALFGGFQGAETTRETRDVRVYKTILDASEMNSAVAIENDDNVTIDGLTITRGQDYTGDGAGIRSMYSTVAIANCEIHTCTGGGGAGGVGIFFGAAEIHNCTITGNRGGQGSGINIYESTVTIEHCLIARNRSDFPPYDGGGLYVLTHTPVNIRDCTITDNVAGKGGGIRMERRKISINDCLFARNLANSYGGGLYASGFASDERDPTFVRNCIFRDNQSYGDGGGVDTWMDGFHLVDCEVTGNQAGAWGGGVSISNTVTLIRCSIRNNVAGYKGGGIINRSTDAKVHNCVIADNTCATEGGGVLQWINPSRYPALYQNCTITNNRAPTGPDVYNEGGMRFANCILWNPDGISLEQGQENSEELVTTLLEHCNIKGGWEGEGNIDSDPLFLDPAGSDYHLGVSSPCIDTASTTGPSDDLDGNPRPKDIGGVGRDGEGAFDMGAYEFQSPFFNSRSDINKDGKVDALDLLILLEECRNPL